MKFYDILKLTDNSTKIRVKLHMFGSYFTATYYAEHYFTTEKAAALVEYEVKTIREADGMLEVVLK